MRRRGAEEERGALFLHKTRTEHHNMVGKYRRAPLFIAAETVSRTLEGFLERRSSFERCSQYCDSMLRGSMAEGLSGLSGG
eukprot:4334150-Pyramimonas_sp.AAC.1